MRRLTFKGPDKEVFSLIWEGLMTGAEPLRGLDKLQLGLRVTSKLREISEPKNGGKGRFLLEVSGPQFVDLSDEEWRFLFGAMQKAPWLIEHAEEAIRAINFVQDAPAVTEG